MKTLVMSIICALLFAPLVMADEKADIEALVRDKIGIVIDTVKNKKLDKAVRNKKIIDTVVPFFEFEFMAKVCLGKQNWQPLSKAQQKEFTDVFVKRLQDFFLEKLDLYTNEEVEVQQAKWVKKRIFVVSHLVSGGEKMEIVFKFRKKKKEKEWKVYDFEILGVSVVQTYRSQFSGFLKNNSFDDLMKKLKSKDGFTVPTDVKKKK